MENNNDAFTYTYSAKQQADIKAIREKYAPKEEDKMARLRRLDSRVTRKASAVALIVGVIGALVLGIGMSLAMEAGFGAFFGLSQTLSMIVGIIIGAFGIIPICCAYPLYNNVLKKERDKIAPEIIRLTDELIK